MSERKIPTNKEVIRQYAGTLTVAVLGFGVLGLYSLIAWLRGVP